MQQMRVAIAVLCVAALASASTFELQFTARNWTGLRPVDAHIHHTGYKPVNLGPLTTGTFFYSLNLDAYAHLNGDSLNASAGADAEAIVAYGGVAANTVPIALYAFFDAEAIAHVGLDLSDLASARAAAAAGAVAMLYEGLVEIDQNGNEVSSRSLMAKGLLGSGTMSWEEDSRADSSDRPGAKYYRIKGTDSSSNLVVYFTWIISSEPGYCEYGNTVLVPKGFETIVEIHSYPYVDKANRLRLRIIGANANAEAKAHAFVSSRGVGAYAEASAKATVNGLEAVAEASAWADYSYDALERLAKGQLLPFHGAWSHDDVRAINITFPSGAETIVYDPVLGAGTSPYAVRDAAEASSRHTEDGNAASGVVPAVAALVAVVAYLL
eukprot:m51a1_g9665 hypothetical protein (382) ;mRNA; r:1230741-1232059